MRVFLAISLPDEMRAGLTAAIRRFAPLIEGVKWCQRDQMHLTLVFLGEVAPAFVQHIAEAVQTVCGTLPAFSCAVNGYGFWGNKRNPTALWAGVEMPPELEELQRRLVRALKKLGFSDLTDEDFRPHITLGRCKTVRKNGALDLLRAMDADPDADFGSLEVAKVTLFESRLTPKGPIYRTMAKFPLAPAEQDGEG